MLTTDGSLPQQLGVVWSRFLEADSEGPSFISHAACARSVSSSRTFLSCACGAPSIPPWARTTALNGTVNLIGPGRDKAHEGRSHGGLYPSGHAGEVSRG